MVTWNVCSMHVSTATFHKVKVVHSKQLRRVIWTASNICSASITRASFVCVPALKYAHDNGCPWGYTTSAAAARYGHAECLQYALVNNCEKTDARLYGRGLCVEAAEGGHLECLQIALEFGCQLDAHAGRAAAKNGDLLFLQYLHEHGCPFNEAVMAVAVTTGHLECVQYLHAVGCGWDTWTSILAAESGQLECLKYMHANGCPWDARATIVAAMKGNMECLRYALEHGCAWGYDWSLQEDPYALCQHAVKSGQLACLQLAHEFGCPWDATTILLAAMGGQLVFARARLSAVCPCVQCCRTGKTQQLC